MLNDMYPKGPKSEWLRQAEDIESGRIRTGNADIPGLLDWLKDMNWPGAEIIAKFLPSFGRELVPQVELVLGSEDDVWIRWVLVALRDSFDATFWMPLADDLKQVACRWDAEHAHVEALYLLARHGLADGEWLSGTLDGMKRIEGAKPDVYAEIDLLLDLSGVRERAADEQGMIAGFLGGLADAMLSSPPFRDWTFVRTVEDDPDDPVVHYECEDHAVDLSCDGDERIRSIFLHSDRHRVADGCLCEVRFDWGRQEVRDHMGVPSKSGEGFVDPILGEYGGWDLFPRLGYAIHVEYRSGRDEVRMITLMRDDVVP